MTRKITAIFVFVVLLFAVGAYIGRYFWLEKLDHSQELRVQEFALSIGKDLERGHALRENAYRSFIEGDPTVGYLVVAGFQSGYRSGVINSTSLQTGAQPLIDFLRVRGDEETLSKLVQNDSGFAGEYLSVIAVTLMPPTRLTDRTPVGMLKVGYVMPGYPYGRAYEKILWASLGLSAVGAVFIWLGRDKQKKKSAVVGRVEFKGMQIPEREVDELSDLEDALDEDTTSVIDEYGREWKVLFDGKSLDGWNPGGEWYITERELAGQPWGASLINATVSSEGSYYFQCRARKMAGPDAFVILFECDGKPLTWVIGGWGNQRSELAGYEKTKSELTIERFRWYKVEVRVEANKIDALLDEQLVFSLSRSEVRNASPTPEFQKGVGVAVWSTLCKFKELRFLPLPSSVH